MIRAMNSEATERTRAPKKCFWIAWLCALALVIFFQALRRSDQNIMTFRIVNADTGEPVTNVVVTAEQPARGLVKELREMDWISGPLVGVEKPQVSCNGIVKIAGPARKSWLRVDFTPDSNFFPVRFFRSTSGDSFSGAGKPHRPQPGRTNQITVALQPYAKPRTASQQRNSEEE
jgi:hypothetical protein